MRPERSEGLAADHGVGQGDESAAFAFRLRILEALGRSAHIAPALHLPAQAAALRAASSVTTKARISASDFPEIRATIRASTSGEGHPTIRGPNETGRVQRRCATRK
jgi:hypothetical protein